MEEFCYKKLDEMIYEDAKKEFSLSFKQDLEQMAILKSACWILNQ